MMCIWPAVAIAPTTSYSNSGGTGDRTASITVTLSFATATWANPVSNLVNGSFAANSTGEIDTLSAANWADGDYFDFNFGVLKYIDEVKLTCLDFSPGYPTGSWKFRYSQDGTNFTDLNTFTWASLIVTQAVTNMPAEGCKRLRIQKVGTGSTTHAVFAEAEFKIAPGAV